MGKTFKLKIRRVFAVAAMMNTQIIIIFSSAILGLVNAGTRESIEIIDPYLGLVEREYLLYLPSSYDETRPHPLVLDFHGWSGSAEGHILDSKWDIVGEEAGVIVVVPDGIPDSESGVRTWNITTEYDDEYGWRCDPDREEYGESECHYSCSEWCRPSYGCTAGTTCYNDLAFIEQLIDRLIESFNLDEEHIHISGYSNGGTFTYRMFSYSEKNIAASGSVSGAPFIGHGAVPNPPRSLIDFHGQDDWTVPLLYDHALGEGPMGEVRTIMSWDALYYYYKPDYLDYVADAYHCSGWDSYTTVMDGVAGWVCMVRRACDGDAEIVKCTGDYGHVYPFHNQDAVAAAKILWEFFAAHPTQL